MGWRQMQTLTERGQYELRKLSDAEGVAFRIPFDGREHEYIYLENIQRSGWNRNVRGHGMLAVHVRYNTSEVVSGDHPNNSPNSIKRITVVPADGRLYSSFTANSDMLADPDHQDEIEEAYLESYRCDPFPGNKNVTELNDKTDYRMTTFDGEQPLGKPIFDIEEKNGVITFTFIEKVIPSLIDHSSSPTTQHPSPIVDLQGRIIAREATAEVIASLPKGIYIIGNKKFSKE